VNMAGCLSANMCQRHALDSRAEFVIASCSPPPDSFREAILLMYV
jgi:hypothetical protein